MDGRKNILNKGVKLKKYLLIFVVLIFSLTSIILLNLRSAASTDEMLRVDTADIKEVVYKVSQKTVSLELQREINDVTILNFRNFNRTEALLLMDMLTSHKGVIVRADLDTGHVYDFGFSYKARGDSD